MKDKYFVQVCVNLVYERYIEADSKEDARSKAYDDVYENGMGEYSLADETINVYA